MQSQPATESPTVPVLQFHNADELTAAIVDLCGPVRLPKPIFPLYIASRIKTALKSRDPNEITPIIDRASVEWRDEQGNADCVHTLKLRDTNGAEYEIRVECVKHADGWVPSRHRKGAGQ
jgi:hypothetical protein